MPGDLEIVQQLRASGNADHRRRQQDRRAQRARGRDAVLRARLRPVFESPPSTAPASATCSTRSSSGCRDRAAPELARDERAGDARPTRRSASRAPGGRHRHRRPAERRASRRWSIGLLREERMLVSDMPGTTRDAVDAVLSGTGEVPHRRHRGHPAPRARGAIRPGGEPQRPGRAARDREGRRRRAGRRRHRRRHRSGRRHCRAKPTSRARRDHRREQVGPGEGRGPDFSQGFDESCGGS